MSTVTTVSSNHSDVLEDLQQEHQQSLRVFEEFKAAAGAARVKPFAELKAMLRQHMQAEEADFYPMVSALGAAQATLISTATTEHTAIKNALTAIESAGAGSASGGQVTTLETALKAHIASERANVFAAARKLSMGQRRQLAALAQANHEASTLT